MHRKIMALWVLTMLAACGGQAPEPSADSRPAAEVDTVPAAGATLPPGADAAAERLRTSPRHAEWVDVDAGAGDNVRAWIVFPERPEPAPVVVVVHEIYGLTEWIRAVADQLAADGFIAIAPDLLSGHDVRMDGADPDREAATAAVRGLDADEVHRRISAVAEYAMTLPAAERRYGIVGFCWGGMIAFEHAVRVPELGASVVYYGTSPEPSRLGAVRTPVLGLYGEDDARVNTTVPAADSAMAARGLSFEHETYAGAGHGFLRQQDGRDGANLAATRAAWPRTVDWLREHLGGGTP